ncbi:MAG: site-specific integrase [Candidatus Cloacimonetes bacterium]|nr:site-specific integrase [Candidatus Cloacimonadota bacterium]
MGQKTKTRILSDQELQKFFGAFNLILKADFFYYHVFRLQFLTGLRISDMMLLNIENTKKKRFTIIEKKTERFNKKRDVYLCDEAFQVAFNLRKLANRLDSYLILTKKNDSSYRRAIKNYCKKAKIKPDRVSTNSLRKTMANKIQVLKGAKAAKTFLNHSRMETTEEYLDGSAETIENAIDVISRGTKCPS